MRKSYKFAFFLTKVLNPTLSFGVNNFNALPASLLSHEQINTSVQSLVHSTQMDWDSYETSWSFTQLPLLIEKQQVVSDIEDSSHSNLISEAYAKLRSEWQGTTIDIQKLEEENNRIFLETFGLQNELTPEIQLNEITLTCNPYYRYGNDKTKNQLETLLLSDTIREFISYAVGCMMGRYSLDTPGLIHAGQPFDPSRHHTFPAAGDGILPITDPAYFEDDIVSRFVEFLKVAYSPDTLTENLDFIATALELKPGQTALQRIRSYFLTEFISDHIKTYKKRPIYWLFTSGKKRGFGALIYLHRYTPATVARLRTDYVLELQLKLDQEIERAQQQQETSTTTAAKKVATKQLKTLQEQQTELRDYQAKLQTIADSRIELDLDDGVAYNYTRFKGLVYEGSDLKMVDLEAKAQWKIELLERERKLVFES